MSEKEPLPLEPYATLRAEIDAGEKLSDAIARAGISEEAWAAAQAYWLKTMAEEAEAKRFETTTRYQIHYRTHRKLFEAERARAQRKAAEAPPPALPTAPVDAAERMLEARSGPAIAAIPLVEPPMVARPVAAPSYQQAPAAPPPVGIIAPAPAPRDFAPPAVVVAGSVASPPTAPAPPIVQAPPAFVAPPAVVPPAVVTAPPRSVPPVVTTAPPPTLTTPPESAPPVTQQLPDPDRGTARTMAVDIQQLLASATPFGAAPAAPLGAGPAVPSTMPAPQMPAPQMPAPQMPAPQMPAPQMPAPQMPAPQMPAPQMQAPQMQAPQMPAPQMQAPVPFQAAGPAGAAPPQRRNPKLMSTMNVNADELTDRAMPFGPAARPPAVDERARGVGAPFDAASAPPPPHAARGRLAALSKTRDALEDDDDEPRTKMIDGAMAAAVAGAAERPLPFGGNDQGKRSAALPFQPPPESQRGDTGARGIDGHRAAAPATAERPPPFGSTTMDGSAPDSARPARAGALPFAPAGPDSRPGDATLPPGMRPAHAQSSPAIPAVRGSSPGFPAVNAPSPSPSAPAHAAPPPAHTAGKIFTLNQFASLTAEIAEAPANVTEIRRKYGITEAQHHAESQRWTEDFAMNSELRQRYFGVVARYRSYLKKG